MRFHYLKEIKEATEVINAFCLPQRNMIFLPAIFFYCDNNNNNVSSLFYDIIKLKHFRKKWTKGWLYSNVALFSVLPIIVEEPTNPQNEQKQGPHLFFAAIALGRFHPAPSPARR